MKQERHEEFMKRASKELEHDTVNNPKHYNQSGVECIKAIEAATGDGFEFYLQGNILKYLWRYGYKNGLEDLKKAQWYLNKLIERIENA
jgi:hypothetical protein